MADPDKPLASTDQAPPARPPLVNPAISDVKPTAPLPPPDTLASEQPGPLHSAPAALSPPTTPQDAVTEPVRATAPQAEPDTAPHLPMQPEPPPDPVPLAEPLVSSQPAPPDSPPEPKRPPVGAERSDASAAEMGAGTGLGTAAGGSTSTEQGGDKGTGAGADGSSGSGSGGGGGSGWGFSGASGATGTASYRQMAQPNLFFPLFAMVAFILYGAFEFSGTGGRGAALSLAVLLGAVALWFIHCVTGKAADKVESLFIFAYAFTFGAFALLLVPVLSDQFPTTAAAPGTVKAAHHNEGALRLVRGCVRADAEGSKTLGLKLAPCPVEPPASAASMPDGIRTTSVRYAWLISVGGVTARTLAFDNCNDAKGVADTAASAAKLAASDKTLADRASAAEKRANAACAAHDSNDPTKPFVEVSGGIAVPLFVVVMALIGGAVSISRRIPEIQRRSDLQYVSTEKEPFMPPYRVREGVVFQIMQLISAPFLAIATMQVIEPNTLASASTLAFATGFFSETILYMIRGVVEGLKPEVTKVAGPVMTNLVGQLVWQDTADPGDFAKVRVELRSERPVEWRNGPVDSDGKFVINGVAAGRYRLVIGGSGIMPVPAQDIEVDDKPPAFIKIAVTKA